MYDTYIKDNFHKRYLILPLLLYHNKTETD